MTTKGYHRYRGRNTRGKVALVIVLVLVLIAAVAYLLTQEYVVYDDEGKAHLELPWSRKEPETPQPDPAPAPDDVDITREQRQKVDAIHAWELPYGCLGGDPGYLLTGREAVAVNVKLYDGSVAYHTAVSLPEGILTGGNATSRNLQTILDSDCYTVARLACFCDNAYADAMGDRAALCTAEGVLYRDGSGRRWLDPTKPETLRYITDLAEECARLGFDEILLDWFLYPTSGDQTALDLPADRTAVLKDFAQALEKQLPEGTVLSVVLRETPAADNGLTPELLTACFDRVYVMPEADASALPTSYDAATRVVAMTAYAPDSGSYLVTQ